MKLNKITVLDPGYEKKEFPPITPVVAFDSVSRESPERVPSVYTTYTSVPIYSAVSPLLFVMKLFGLYHSRDYDWPSAEPPRLCCTEKKDRKCYLSKEFIKWTPSRIYSTIILIVLMLNVGRLMYAFNGDNNFGPILFAKVATLTWLTLCLFNSIVSYSACAKYEKLPAFFIQLDKIHATQRRAALCVKLFRRHVILCMVVTFVLVLASMVLGLYGLFYTRIFDMMLTPFGPEDAIAPYIRGVYAILSLFIQTSWIFVPTLHYMLASIVHHEFNHFNVQLKSRIGKNGKFDGDIERMRQKHEDLCTLVSHLDECVSLHNAVAIISQMLIVLLVMYNILWYPDVRSDTIALAAFCFWLVAGFLYLGVVAIGGALVNQVAHASLDTVFNINMAALPVTSHQQMGVFLSRLSGSPIGFTALKMFVIDKPTILTILGMLVTYFVLMVQFSPAFTESSTSPPYNCTCAAINTSTSSN